MGNTEDYESVVSRTKLSSFSLALNLIFILSLYAGFTPAFAVNAGQLYSLNQSLLPATHTVLPWQNDTLSTPDSEREFKTIHSKIGKITPYDKTALHGRTPLLLVHGILGENLRYNHWESFLKYVRHNQNFNQKFKVYLYRYDSTESVPNISKDYENSLKTFIGELDNRKIRILAYSEGGLLTRNAMENAFIRSHTDKVITIGSPFHGSPLANASWLRKELKTEPLLSPVRFTNRFTYWVARKILPTFEKDFHWDNFDHALSGALQPHIQGQAPSTESLAKQMDETPSRPSSLSMESTNANNLTQFTTYASYFGANSNDAEILRKELGLRMDFPKEKARIRTLMSKHIFIGLVRDNIARLPIALLVKKQDSTQHTLKNEQAELESPTADKFGSAFLAVNDTGDKRVSSMTDAKFNALTTSSSRLNPFMDFNDGISPITSTLWLGRYLQEFSQIKDPVAQSWAALKKLKSTSNARLFASLDHRDWMEGITRAADSKVVDLLHPEQGCKCVFDWLIQDIMSPSSAS